MIPDEHFKYGVTTPSLKKIGPDIFMGTWQKKRIIIIKIKIIILRIAIRSSRSIGKDLNNYRSFHGKVERPNNNNINQTKYSKVFPKYRERP